MPLTPVQHRFAAAVTQRCADAAVIGLSLWLAYSLRGLHDPDQYVLAGVVAPLLYLLAGGGQPVRNEPGPALVQDVGKALGAWAWTIGGLLAIAWMAKATADYSRIAIGLWAMFGTAGLASWRLAGHVVLRSARGDPEAPPAVIAGDGPQARSFARVLQSTGAFRSTLAGYFAEEGGGESGTDAMPVPYLGDLDALVAGARRREFSTVFLTLPANSEDIGQRIVAKLADTPAGVYVVPSPFIEELAHARWVSLGGLPLISVFESPYAGINGWIKRVEDLVLSVVILAAAAVPMLLIAAAVRLTSPGPVLFRQRRHGIDGREFRIFKFRTMTVQEDGDAVRQAVRNDERLSPIGAFLRRTFLDELPQFFNVVRGDMSVVGPRPHAVADNEHYRRLIPGYMMRHRVRPGITGWAQVHGLRGTKTVANMRERVRYDLWYLSRWSLWLDLWIVARTATYLAGHRKAV